MSPCMHHITEFFLYLQHKQMMQQVLEKARLALELHEVEKAMRGWILHIYSSKEVLHHLDFFIFLSDILTNKFIT